MKYPEIGHFYRHYKGGLYQVITLAKHSETDEVLVVYQSIHFGSVHARPLDKWNEQVLTESASNRIRFKYERNYHE